jgi:hypothetical protein
LSALQNEARAGQKSEQRQLKNASKKTNLYRPGARTRFAAEICQSTSRKRILVLENEIERENDRRSLRGPGNQTRNEK